MSLLNGNHPVSRAENREHLAQLSCPKLWRSLTAHKWTWRPEKFIFSFINFSHIALNLLYEYDINAQFKSPMKHRLNKRWTTRLHFLSLYKSEAKIFWKRVLPSCTFDVIWSQRLSSRDQGPAHTPTLSNHSTHTQLSVFIAANDSLKPKSSE